MVFGTAGQTYQMAGIDSQLSKDRQSGPLRLVTSDANGNLATDGGAVFKEVSRLKAGVAAAMAMQAPTLANDDRFALRFGYSNFDGSANAVGLTAMGVICERCYMGIDRFSVDAGASIGNSSYYTYGSGPVAGVRVGAQLTFK
jgi:hypothetical protein